MPAVEQGTRGRGNLCRLLEFLIKTEMIKKTISEVEREIVKAAIEAVSFGDITRTFFVQFKKQ